MRMMLLASAAAIAVTGCNSEPPELDAEDSAALSENGVDDASMKESGEDAAASADPDMADTDSAMGMDADADPMDGADMDDGMESGMAQSAETLTTAPVVNVSDTSPEETGAPNVDYVEPAFDGQTRAPKPAVTHAWTIEPVTDGLDSPWGFEFLPSGAMLVTEKAGTMHVVQPDGTVSAPIGGVPEVDNRDQGGLLDVALSPDFANDRMVYLTYSEPRGNGENGTAVARGRFEGGRLNDVEVIFQQDPAWASTMHYGSRIVFAPDGTLFIGLGERSDDPPRDRAQNPDDHIGTVVRINPDGSIPEDNPFADGEGGAPEVWAYGIRNIQAAALNPSTEALWTIEHGPRGGDELNIPEAGKNYGWPTITYGQNYDGSTMGEGIAQQEGMEQPVYYWDPVIAPSGMTFYDGEVFPEWRGDIFVGGLASMQVVRLVLDGDRVAAEEWLEAPSRVRDVKTGPDGAIYLALEAADNQIVRIVPDQSGQ